MSAIDPYEELNKMRDRARHHAEMGSTYANSAQGNSSEGDKARAALHAQLSIAHSLASLATATGGGILTVEDLKS